jgi:hypothetical protein
VIGPIPEKRRKPGGAACFNAEESGKIKKQGGNDQKNVSFC